MTDRRWHAIWWIEQCEAAEAIMLRYGVEAAFDYAVGEKLLNFAEVAVDHPGFAHELPRFVSRVRGMFTPQEIEVHLARIKRRRLEHDMAAMEDDDPDVESPAAAAARARQFALIKEQLMAPALGTRDRCGKTSTDIFGPSMARAWPIGEAPGCGDRLRLRGVSRPGRADALRDGEPGRR